MLKKLEKASESSWHAIWNLSDRTSTSRNEEAIIQKESHGDKKSDVLGGGGGPWSPSSGEWVQESALGASSWHQCGCSHDEAAVRLLQWVFHAAGVDKRESRKEEIGRCQVLTTAGKWVWLGPKLLTYDYCQPFSSTDWLKRNLIFYVLHPQRRALLSVPFFNSTI